MDGQTATPLRLGAFALTINGCLAQADCDAIIAAAQNKLDPSGLLGAQRENYRTSSGAWLGPNDAPEALRTLRALVIEVTGLPPENQESIQVLRYEKGQEYREHQDFWHPGTDYYDEQMARGGQRAWTVMVYLNTVPEGGGTRFPRLGIDVLPETGKLLAWRNTLDDELNYDSLHAGLPVDEGVKWVAVTWVRETAFT
jgi:prolyl 4-hydroxylase